jgi:hypothetical protein
MNEIIYKYHNVGKVFSDNRFKLKRANDIAMKYLRDKAVSQQDKQALKSKRIQGIAYLGINQLGDLRFATKSEDGKETYIQSIRFYDLQKRKPKTKNELLAAMNNSDIGVYCNDPSFLYWGAAYNATKYGYNIVVENRVPTKHVELKKKFVLCKHLIALLRAAPFWWAQILKDYQEYFRIKEDDQSTKPTTSTAQTNKNEKLEEVEKPKPAGVGTKNAKINEGEE